MLENLILVINSKQYSKVIEKKVGYTMDITRLVNPITVYSYGFLFNCTIVGNPNPKKMHIFGFVGIFEYIC